MADRRRQLWLQVRTLVLSLFVVSHGAYANSQELQDGDIIFHTSKSAQSLAIQQATGSKYSHVGLILFRDRQPFVFEAVSPVRFTPLASWIQRGSGRHFVVKRLKDPEALREQLKLKKFRDVALTFEGKPYDLTFEWSDDRIYCSELVWKVFQRALGIELGRLQRLSEFNLSSPEVKKKIRERYGSLVPLSELVISPQAIFDSSLLVTIDEK